MGFWAKLFGGQRGEYKCTRCRNYFSTDQIQEQGRYVGEICSAGLMQQLPGLNAYSVGGSISVFDNGLAYPGIGLTRFSIIPTQGIYIKAGPAFSMICTYFLKITANSATLKN
jgi:DNA-directed RNA polymerase subunit RPC12/RpoP